MTRFTTLAAAVSLLVLPAASAFAEGEGTYAPSTVAWSAAGPAVDRGVGASFAFNAGEGAQDAGRPAPAAPRAVAAPAVAGGTFRFNEAQNG